MAVDQRVPRDVMDRVMADPTCQRLICATGMSSSDMKTDLSYLIAEALEAWCQVPGPRRQVVDLREPETVRSSAASSAGG